MRYYNTYAKVDQAVLRLSAGSAAVASLMVLLLLIGNVVDSMSRAVSGRTIPGILEASENLLVAIVFLALGFAYRKGAHVAIGGLIDALPAWMGSLLYKVVLGGATALVIYLTIETGIQALESVQTGEVRQGIVYMPVWPARAAIAIGFAVLCLEMLVDLLRPNANATVDLASSSV